MGKTHYTKIRYKGKHEYIWDEDGKYIRNKSKFIIDKTTGVNDKLKKESNDLIKGYPYIKQRVKVIKNMEKKIYYAKVWIMTEGNDLTKLKNFKKRSFRGYHLDHQFPIAEGFKKDIPPEVISHIDNLKFIPAKKNLRKRDTITHETEKLIESIKKKVK